MEIMKAQKLEYEVGNLHLLNDFLHEHVDYLWIIKFKLAKMGVGSWYIYKPL